MFSAIAMLLLALATDPASQVRNAETAFAQAFAEGDAAKFASFVADDAQFLSRAKTLSGKAEVMAAWSPLLKDHAFSWRPERVAVNASGDLGMTWGPVFDAKGTHIGNFTSTWQKRDGKWLVVFDAPPARVCGDK